MMYSKAAAISTCCLFSGSALAWDSLPVADSVTMFGSGDEYLVEIGCKKSKGMTLNLEIIRAYPPIDEIQRINSISLDIAGPSGSGFSRDVEVIYSDYRANKVVGEFGVSEGDLQDFAAATSMSIRDLGTGRVIFTSDMKGSATGRNMFRDVCGI